MEITISSVYPVDQSLSMQSFWVCKAFEYAKLLIKASQETGDELDFAVRRGRMHADAPWVLVFVMDTALPSFDFTLERSIIHFMVDSNLLKAIQPHTIVFLGNSKGRWRLWWLSCRNVGTRCRWIMILQS
jgi:hypothetical protein